jgi:hypothetical protein
VEVKAGKRMRKDIYVLEVDHPDLFLHRVPEEVLEGNVRGTDETSLGLEGNAFLRPSGSTVQGLLRDPNEAGRYDKPRNAPCLHRFPMRRC